MHLLLSHAAESLAQVAGGEQECPRWIPKRLECVSPIVATAVVNGRMGASTKKLYICTAYM